MAAVGVPGATRGFLVQHNTIFNGEWRIVVLPQPAWIDALREPVAVYGEPDGVPIARWHERAADVEWYGSVVASPTPAPHDSLIVVSIEVRARNVGSRPRPVKLTFRLEQAEADRAFTAFVAAPADDDSLGMDLINGWCGADASGPDATFEKELRPGGSASFRILMPSAPAPRRVLEAMAKVSHAQYVRQCREQWQERWESGMDVVLGDEEVERACRQALAVLLCAWEKRDRNLLPIGGPFHYRDMWIRDGARSITALAVWGQSELARELARGLLAYQWPQGFIVSQRGQPDGTGQALWALEQSHLRGPDQAVPGSVIEGAVRAWRWLEQQRQYPGPGITGLQPYATPNDNEGVRAQLTGTDFWAMAGYLATERLGRSVGANALAESVRASKEEYRRAIADRLHAFEDIPPSWQGCGWDWGNVSAVYPCGVLASADPRMARVAARLWAKVGGAGLCAYGDPDSLHYYHGADLATWAILAGRAASADSVLGAMLYWRTASGGAPELFSRSRRDFGNNLPPHSTSAAALLTLVRNMLVCDVDDTLRLTLGARAKWWKHGGHVRQAPTRWGNVDLSFKIRGDVAEWRWSPVPVWTTLALPPGLEAVDGSGMPRSTELRYPPGASRARIRVRATT